MDYNSLISNSDLLIQSLEKYIKLREQKLKTPKLLEEIKELEEYRDYCHKAMKGLIPISDLRDSDIDIIPASDRNYWIQLKQVSKLEKHDGSDNVKVDKEQRVNLRDIYHNLYADFNEKINKKNEDIKRYNESKQIDEIELYKKTLEKLKNDLVLEEYNVLCIKNMFNDFDMNLTDKEIYQMNIFLGNYLLVKHSMVDLNELPNDDEQEEEIKPNEEEIPDEILASLFKKYGYDYNIVKESKKEILRKYGRTELIDSIFEALSKFKIYDYNVSNSLSMILVYSTPEIVDTVIKNIIADSKDPSKNEEIFNTFITSYEYFISGRKVEKKSTEQEFRKFDGVSGHFNNYQKNRLFFQQHNWDINKIMESSLSIFGRTNQTLVDTYAKLISYEFKDDMIEGSITCLSVDDVYKWLDSFIEVGCINHMYKYPSSSVKPFANIIRRILIAQKLDLPVTKKSEVFYSYIHMSDKKLMSNPKTDIYRQIGIVTNDEEEKNKKIDEYLGISDYFKGPELEKIKETWSLKVKDAIQDPNSNIEENPFIKYIEDEYLYNDDLYKFGDVNISRRKVLRVYNELLKTYKDYDNPEYCKELLMFTITYNSILNQEQINTIEKIVDHIIIKGKEFKL